MEKINKKTWTDYAYLYDKFTPSYQEDLLKFIGERVYGNTIDVGTGVGKLLKFLSNESKIDSFLGLDGNESMLKFAKKKYENQKFPISFSHYDIDNSQTSIKDFGIYNSIVSLNVIYGIQNPIGFLKDCYSNLSENGSLFLSGPIRNLNLEAFLNILKNEFDLEDPEFQTFLELNQKLISVAKTYEMTEMTKILKLIGFENIQTWDNFFLGNNYTIIAKRKNLQDFLH